MTLETSTLQQSLQRGAKNNLWMQFTRQGSFTDADVPVIVRGEGACIWDDASAGSGSGSARSATTLSPISSPVPRG
jgi:adenosylmethionine-8-amino-7-oxononanoate aminotransferase